MPPHTSTVPGTTGSTVPARPNTIKAAHKTQSKVISKAAFQSLATKQVAGNMVLSDGTSRPCVLQGAALQTNKSNPCVSTLRNAAVKAASAA